MAKTVKTAITIPNEDFKMIEALRKKTGKNRSQIIVEAFQDWAKRKKTEELERQYEEGYRKHPESKAELDELRSWTKGEAKIWTENPW